MSADVHSRPHDPQRRLPGRRAGSGRRSPQQGRGALGTDSLASCPDLDLLAEARSTRDVARRQGLEHPEEALVRALTLGGARAVGQDLGTLEVGRRADLAVFDVPTDAPYQGLVEHGAGRCVATVLGGRLVHRR